MNTPEYDFDVHLYNRLIYDTAVVSTKASLIQWSPLALDIQKNREPSLPTPGLPTPGLPTPGLPTPGLPTPPTTNPIFATPPPLFTRLKKPLQKIRNAVRRNRRRISRCYKIRDECCNKVKCCRGILRRVLAFDLCAKLYPDKCRCNRNRNCLETSGGSGYAQFRVNVFEDFPASQIQYYIRYSKLSSPVISVLLKGPVENCKHEARTAVPLGLISTAVGNSLENYVLGAAYLTCQQTRDLLLGKYYIVVRTKIHPECEGEIAGSLHCMNNKQCRFTCVCTSARNNLRIGKIFDLKKFQGRQKDNSCDD
jgi:hypothetical protein